MRKVMVSKPKLATFTNPDGSICQNVWRLEESGIALFHQFGIDYEEFEAGPASYSTAIVEWPDGTVENVRADRIRFLSPQEDCPPFFQWEFDPVRKCFVVPWKNGDQNG